MMRIRPIQPGEVVSRFMKTIELVQTENEGIQRQFLLAEYLRTTLCALATSHGDSLEGRAVYGSLLTRTVRRQVSLIWPEMNPAEVDLDFRDTEERVEEGTIVNRVLRQLLALGDVTHLGHNYWLPIPAKLIHLPDTELVAVISGLGTRRLKSVIPGLKVAGYGRVVLKPDLDDQPALDITYQDYSDWVGSIPRDISEWTTQQLSQLDTHGALSSSTFHYYDVFVSRPEIARRTRQAWIPVMDIGPVNDVSLCRSKRPMLFFLGMFVNGKLMKEMPVSREIAEWLQIGLRLRDGHRPYAVWNGNTLRITPRPPAPIRRHLSLFSIAFEPKPHQVAYWVQPRFHSLVDGLLQQHGYRVTRKGGTST